MDTNSYYPKSLILHAKLKNSLQDRRKSLMMIKSCDHHDHDDDLDVLIRNTYIHTIESEITNICNDVVSLLDYYLIPNAPNVNYQVYYLKLKGDYYRYLAEVHVGIEREKLAEMSLTVYKAAKAMAEAELAVTHPVRLGVALNMSVLYYDVMNSPENAFDVAEEAYAEALPELVVVEDRKSGYYEKTVGSLGVLAENISFWKRNMQEEEQN